MALLDRRILDALALLPSYAPRAEFSERVLARIRRPEPAWIRLRGRLALAASVVLSLGASIAWTLFNRNFLLSQINLAAAETGRTFWLGVRVVATNLTAQPWYSPFREFASSPWRLAALLSGSLVAYAVALVALRKLLTPPSRPVPNANW